MEFNADGSLKLGGALGAQQDDENHRMATTPCVKITKDVTRTFSPKMCTLRIVASAYVEPGMLKKTFDFFKNRVDSTVKFSEFSSTEAQVTIGPEFSRCRDCQTFVSSFRNYLDGNVIEKKGNCPYKGDNTWFR